MKKLIFSSTLLISSLFYSQSNKIVVEIDDSRRYIYESTLNKLRADSYKREVADGIKIHADRYFTELQKIADFFNGIDEKHKQALNNEIDKMKVYGFDIINLLKDYEKDQMTGVKMKYVLEKASYELSHISEKQEFKDLIIYKALSDVKRDVLANTTDEILFVMVQDVSGIGGVDLLKMHKSDFTHLTLREFLLEQYEKYFFIKQKYKIN